MKKLTVEQMVEIKGGGSWCVWGAGLIWFFSYFGDAKAFADSHGYEWSYCED